MTSWAFSIPALTDLALLLLRLVVGGMFAMSGFFKLTDPERGRKMAGSLQQAGLPTGLTPLLSALELIGGLLVVLGALMVPGTAILLGISVGALLTTSIPKAEGHGIHKLENILYTPEAILSAALMFLVAIGAGNWAIDAIWH